MFWKDAPDYRTTTTLDWINNACEQRLARRDRDHGLVGYAALMSPVSVTFPASPSFRIRHPFSWASSTARRKRPYKPPISLLLSPGLMAPPYLLLGARRRVGRRAKVTCYMLEGATRGDRPGRPDDCLLDLPRHGAITVAFSTQFEADALADFIVGRVPPSAALYAPRPI